MTERETLIERLKQMANDCAMYSQTEWSDLVLEAIGALEASAEGCRPYDTAPDVGHFLVVLDESNRPLRWEIMKRGKGAGGECIEMVGGRFGFDLRKPPIAWHPLPDLPFPPEPQQ